MKITYNKNEYELTDKLAFSINAYIDAIIKYNQDLVIVFDGEEGAGKSTLMRQVGAYAKLYLQEKYNIDRPLNLDNIHFSLDEYSQKAIKHEKEKGWVHILDESRAVANRKRSMSKGNIAFTNYLSECRSAGHIHLIALPAFHDLDSYIATFRCSFLINIKKYFRQKNTSGGVPIYELVLGTYRVFLNDSKLKAMYHHKMRYIYPRQAVFEGRFPDIDLVNSEDYEEKKRAARKKRYEEENGEKKKKVMTKKQQIFQYKATHPEATYKEIGEALGCNHKYVHEVLNDPTSSSV